MSLIEERDKKYLELVKKLFKNISTYTPEIHVLCNDDDLLISINGDFTMKRKEFHKLYNFVKKLG